ncbi:methionine ABC transporter ATP-binding protein [Uliginosibacterium sp. 31-16]|uniref:methionine ABC transporter ATP-binding protein n=1 Tax=Uliginosibacterium sp. 31-16 TaxID=3068315 RepID=UPI00273F1C75|nr:methionine ABC transporter ATP-binding protein [Uliginosibacterium sp. 31-16]MDP5240801.1 methionine ABC transporter ATP-binding protein [Uliginosibacterium sp. 31-16]
MIHLENVSKTYRIGAREIHAAKGVNLHVKTGEIFGVVGHSGAGKSTLVRLINRLETADAGRILVDGDEVLSLDPDELRALRRRVGMIFQHFNLLGSRTVAQNVAIPLRVAGLTDSEQINARVAELLDLVGLADQRHEYPAQLSGGQKQRVGIARALANRPKVLLCDEATSALDPQTTRSVLELLEQINRSLGLTIVLITHEMNVVRSICDRVAVMDGGEIVESGAVTQVFLHPQHPTSRAFVNEAEHLDELEEVLKVANVEGRVVRLTFIGDDAYAPHLAHAVREHGLDFTILSGHIERIKTTPCGQLTLALRGTSRAQDVAISHLKQQGVGVEFLQ